MLKDHSKRLLMLKHAGKRFPMLKDSFKRLLMLKHASKKFLFVYQINTFVITLSIHLVV